MNRRERKKEMTKSNIIECAMNMFKEKGFNETSMEEIAEKADISKGTLYNYFQDKESIIGGYFQSNTADYSEEFLLTFREHEGIRNQLNKIIDFMNFLFLSDIKLSEIYFSHRIKIIFSGNFHDSDRSGLEGLILQVLKEGQDNKELKKDIPLEIMARNFMFLHMNFFISNTYGNEKVEPEYINNQLIELFLNGAKN